MKHVEQLIIRHFSDDDLSAEERADLREHLHTCEACREEYDRTAELLRASAGAEDEPTKWELDSWRQAVVDAMDQDPTPEPEPRRSWFAAGLLLRLAPGLAVAALVVIAVLVARHQPTTKVPDVQYRGTPDAGSGPGTAAPPARVVLVDLEVFAIRASADAPPVPRRLAPGDSIALDEYMQFSRICSDTRIKHLYVLGLDQRLQPLDYYPRPSAQQSIAVHACSTTPRTIGRSIRLAKRHVKGPLWVVAL